MANLILKKGSFDDFKLKVKDANAAVEGALYFTEDEGGLYLGAKDGKVVRIQGTVHQYATLTDFAEGTKPPYSTDVVYFIAEKDALVRYNGTKWVQLNTPASVTEAMQTSINTLTDNVATNAENIQKNVTAIAGLNTDLTGKINDLTGRMTTAEGAIATKAESSVVEGLAGRLDTAEDNISTNADDIADIKEALTGKAAAADLEALTGRVSKNETDIAGLRTDVDAKASQDDFNTLKGRVDTAEDNIEANGELIAGHTTAIEKNTTDIGNLTTAVGTKADASALQELAGVVATKAAADDVTAIGNRVSTIEDTLPDKVDKVDGKGLSTNDFTDALMSKLEGIAEGATNVTVDAELSDSSENPVQNKAIASKLTEMSGTLTSHGDAIDDIYDTMATDDEVEAIRSDLQGKINEINAALGGDENGKSVDARLSALEGDNVTNKAAIEDHGTRIGTLEDNVSTLTDALNAEDGLVSKIEAAEDAIEALQTQTGTNTSDISTLNTKVATAEADIDKLEAADVTITTRINTVEDNLEEAIEQVGKDIDAAEEALTELINNKILAANAMTYKGKVNGTTDLPTEDVSVGDTYVVISNFGDYKVGDLLIADGIEGENGIIGEITWDHVPTGYSDTHESSLVVEDNSISLRDFADKDLGTVVIKSASENIVITTENTNEITMTLQWGTF